MEKFKQYFDDRTIRGGLKYKSAYTKIKPYLIQRIAEIKKSITRRGRPVLMDYNRFFDVLFLTVDQGTKYRTATDFGIPKSTFTRHVKFLADAVAHNVLETVDNELIGELDLPSNGLLVTDT